jgi:DNA-nicking Smr family endonuclease
MKKGKKETKTGDSEAEKLWRHVTRSVEPLKPRAKPAKPAVTAKDKPATTKEKPRLPPAPPPKLQPSPAPPAFDKGEEEKLRRGKREMEAKLDLHGMGQAEAYDALHRFIIRSRGRDLRNLLVITGKGRVGGGVLRRLLPLWLEEASLRGAILAFTPARREDGGEGAFYIRLRKK